MSHCRNSPKNQQKNRRKSQNRYHKHKYGAHFPGLVKATPSSLAKDNRITGTNTFNLTFWYIADVLSINYLNLDNWIALIYGFPNQSLLFLLNAVCLEEKQQIPIL